MNPYVMVGQDVETTEGVLLRARLMAWHDAMVAHERRLLTSRDQDICHDECPHVQARTLWAEALSLLGAAANQLTFLRSRAGAAAGRPPQTSTALHERRGHTFSAKEN